MRAFAPSLPSAHFNSTKSRLSTRLLAPVVGGLAILGCAMPGKALTTICSANWTSSVSANNPISATLTNTSPCPPSSVTATLSTVGGVLNAGTVNQTDSIGGTGTNNYFRTSVSSVDIATAGIASQAFVLTFSQAVTNPYLFFTYTDNNTSFTFTQPFQLAQANNASAAAQVVTVAGTGGLNTNNDGFVVQMLGTYSTINFTFTSSSSTPQSVAFTTGFEVTPAPLPLLGASMAFGISRRLRRRIRLV